MGKQKLNKSEKQRLRILLSASCVKADSAINEMLRLLEKNGKTKDALAFKQLLLSLRVNYNRAKI